MDGRCKSCRWWNQDDDASCLQTMAGEFNFVRYDWEEEPDPLKRSDFRACELTAYGQPRYDYPDSLALSVDAETYLAELYTSPEFGCIQWEAFGSDPDQPVVEDRPVGNES